VVRTAAWTGSSREYFLSLSFVSAIIIHHRIAFLSVCNVYLTLFSILSPIRNIVTFPRLHCAFLFPSCCLHPPTTPN
jgi:hypothetical protein